MKELGVGIVCLPGLESIVDSFPDFIQVLEIEPQTTWYQKKLGDEFFTIDHQTTDWLIAQNKPLVFHSISMPVGGTAPPEMRDLETMKKHIELLKPVYISEHLSFNKSTSKSQNYFDLNFLIPPIQNEKGIKLAVENIAKWKKQFGIPFAFETGVNYFRSYQDEIPDGRFVAEIADRSDSMILLDIHNLMTNQLNGRQSIKDYIQMLPLERVVEIHLAGGYYEDEFYLDAHSHISSNELLEITMDIVMKLPNLKTIVFEMIPEYLNRSIQKSDLQYQFESMARIWDSRGRNVKKKSSLESHLETAGLDIDPLNWENSIADLLNDLPNPDTKLDWLQNEGGIQILKKMIFEIRASSISSSLKMTCRYITLLKGVEYMEELIRKFCRYHHPEMFGYSNARLFSQFLLLENTDIRYLVEIIEFEMLAIESHLTQTRREIDMPFDPFEFIQSLINFEIPEFQSFNDVIYRTELSDFGSVFSDRGAQYQVDYHS